MAPGAVAKSSEMQCAMAASQNYSLYCHGGTRCLLVEETNLEEVLNITQKEGTPMKDLKVNWQCKIDRGE